MREQQTKLLKEMAHNLRMQALIFKGALMLEKQTCETMLQEWEMRHGDDHPNNNDLEQIRGQRYEAALDLEGIIRGLEEIEVAL